MNVDFFLYISESTGLLSFPSKGRQCKQLLVPMIVDDANNLYINDLCAYMTKMQRGYLKETLN